MFNPIQEYRLIGSSQLEIKLNQCDKDELLNIIKKYMPDNTRKIYKITDIDKLVEYILYRSEKLANKGSVFVN